MLIDQLLSDEPDAPANDLQPVPRVHRRRGACYDRGNDRPAAMEPLMPDTLRLVRHAERPTIAFPGGAVYRPIIGDDTGAGIPVRTGIQVSPPGYETRPHSHPYAEILTVLEGEGEAWLDGDAQRVALEPGVTIAIPANRAHGFRATGDRPLVTYGIHASEKRIVDYHD
jgi:quercetin dioxygenase-like cupin family protein